MIDETVTAFGALHVMVANAGIAQVAPALEVSEEDVSRMFNVNFMGVWNCYTAAGKQMIKQGPVSAPVSFTDDVVCQGDWSS